LSCHEDKITRKSPVQSIEFGGEVPVKTVEAVGEYLAVVYTSTPYQSLEKWPILKE
jgi:hypothetical protein